VSNFVLKLMPISSCVASAWCSASQLHPALVSEWYSLRTARPVEREFGFAEHPHNELSLIIKQNTMTDAISADFASAC